MCGVECGDIGLYCLWCIVCGIDGDEQDVYVVCLWVEFCQYFYQLCEGFGVDIGVVCVVEVDECDVVVECIGVDRMVVVVCQFE